ncbi:MAG: hypothetical protein U1C04_20310 [Hydrogenophaga sp.]|uniref:hypothetical protein n=1 Tax=Hydrogenophaga sp. TaxID=1904254 RepID=UPI002ABCDCD6|nr:hypothetical protein [Hydrogenophaga sp.]MDZ4283096.1 hypothetical protein [Hydrogenophaga sp.]
MKNCIGLDVGRGSVKVVAATTGGQRTQLDFPSAFCKTFRMTDASALARSKILAQSIAKKAGQLFGELVRSLGGIRVAGGGAPLVRDAIAKWTDSASGGTVPAEYVIVVPNARFVVAEGFLRFALGLELKRAQVAAV